MDFSAPRIDPKLEAMAHEAEKYKRRCEVLEAEIDLLKERERQFAKAAVANFDAQVFFGLTGKQAMLLSCLMQKEHCSKEDLFLSMYSALVDEPPDLKIVDVFICKMRQKLKIYDIMIDTIWGVGYCLSQENKQKIKKLLEPMK